jgi:dTDP-4-amino-4,6-dideoxygalactose transaminase
LNNITPFNKPYLHGRELVYISSSVASGKISGEGVFTHKCNDLFKNRSNFNQILLTTSCTDAIENGGNFAKYLAW